jgi:Family of unknown function (DUF5683)
MLLYAPRMACAAALFGWAWSMVMAQDTTVHSGRLPEAERPWELRHSPKRAAIYSAILPGAGQVYNRKYWKVPIALGGLGLCYHFIRTNTSEYERYRDAYVAIVDGDSSTVDPFNGSASSSSVLEVAETYRRWRDMSYIAIGLVYVLNVMDASVDAHFVRFDVGDDLSVALLPSPYHAAHGAVGLRVGVCF